MLLHVYYYLAFNEEEILRLKQHTQCIFCYAQKLESYFYCCHFLSSDKSNRQGNPHGQYRFSFFGEFDLEKHIAITFYFIPNY